MVLLGVYAAATDPANSILQPNDLSGVGEYSIRASVVSPALNVLCVNMVADELSPLIKANTTDFIPNATVVDDIFKWGERPRPPFEKVSAKARRPQAIQLLGYLLTHLSQLPIDFNILTNALVVGSDSVYILGKSPKTNYTLCQLRSWLSVNCSTHFDVSGTTGGHMQAHCEDPDDVNSYHRSFPDVNSTLPASDWRVRCQSSHTRIVETPANSTPTSRT
jgi:hypothetical protein